MTSPLLVGSVAYTPNVVTIWEGIREYFAGTPAEMDFVLYSNYGRQVEALIGGQIDLSIGPSAASVSAMTRAMSSPLVRSPVGLPRS